MQQICTISVADFADKQDLEVPNVGRARAKKTRFYWYPAHSLHENFSCKPVMPVECIHSEGVLFGCLNPPFIKNPKLENPQTPPPPPKKKIYLDRRNNNNN